MSLIELRKIALASLLSLVALTILPACSTTEEEDTSTTKDEICDEADAGAQGCPK